MKENTITDMATTKGRVQWEILENGVKIRGGDVPNTINIGYKTGARNMLLSGSSIGMITTMTAGTVDTTFTETSTALGNQIASVDATVAEGANVKQVVATALFRYADIGLSAIEELGLETDTTIVALNNGISDALENQWQILKITWTITIN